MNELQNPFLDVNNYQDGTPANAVVRFFHALKTRRSDLMLEVCQITWKSKPKAKEKLEMWFGTVVLHGMKIKRIRRVSDTTYDITMHVGIKHLNKTKAIITIIKGRVVCEKAPYEPSIDGKWGVNPVGMLRGFGIINQVFIDPDNPLAPLIN